MKMCEQILKTAPHNNSNSFISKKRSTMIAGLEAAAIKKQEKANNIPSYHFAAI